MKPWLPLESADWEAASESITKPWPEAFALFDLRWRDEAGKRLTYRIYIQRWGWGEYRVRALLKRAQSEGISVLKDGTTASSPQDHRKPAAKPPQPREVEPAQSEEILADSPQDHRKTTASSPQPIHREKEIRDRDKTITSSSSPVGKVWERYRTYHPRSGDVPFGNVKARVAAHGLEAVLRVIDWAHKSNHDRAVFLRKKKLTGQTLFRPDNFAEYLDFANEWEVAPSGNKGLSDDELPEWLRP